MLVGGARLLADQPHVLQQPVSVIKISKTNLGIRRSSMEEIEAARRESKFQ